MEKKIKKEPFLIALCHPLSSRLWSSHAALRDAALSWAQGHLLAKVCCANIMGHFVCMCVPGEVNICASYLAMVCIFVQVKIRTSPECQAEVRVRVYTVASGPGNSRSRTPWPGHSWHLSVGNSLAHALLGSVFAKYVWGKGAKERDAHKDALLFPNWQRPHYQCFIHIHKIRYGSYKTAFIVAKDKVWDDNSFKEELHET